MRNIKTVKKWRILPRLAFTGGMKNKAVYYPYIGAGIFSVFTYFVFSSILHNDIISILPKSMYAWMLLQTGRVLLGFILLPFLYYTNSFLMKRRKKEIGLYSILGLEKKHIGIIISLEVLLTFGLVLTGGIIGGTVFSKLLFLLLLKMTGLPINVDFVFYPAAFAETAVFFFFAYALNLVSNLLQAGKSKPIELLSGGKKGEKELRFLWLYAVLGIAVLGWGYYIAVTSKVDSMIFSNFFFAVLLVVAGTYLLFTSGSVAFLKILKNKKNVYYRPENFITISGMLYRMKKNAASLVNICIFSTMVIITMICTFALYSGLDEISNFDYPYDAEISFTCAEAAKASGVKDKMTELEEKYDVSVTDMTGYEFISLSCGKEGDSFRVIYSDREINIDEQIDNYNVNILMLEDYNKMQGENLMLEDGEAVIFSTGADFGHASLDFMGNKLVIKEEPDKLPIAPKSDKNLFLQEYYLVLKDKTAYDICVGSWAEANGVQDLKAFADSRIFMLHFNTEGKETDRHAFIEEFGQACLNESEFIQYSNNLDGRAEILSMNGGFLFIGLLFGFVFMMCLLLIMYYKQISEGYEDQDSFWIMQKVGMSEREIRSTIQRQILQVFFLPLLGAVAHTIAGLFMVNQLFAVLRFFNTGLIISCAAAVTVIFVLIYGLCYIMTAKVYYGIVRREK